MWNVSKRCFGKGLPLLFEKRFAYARGMRLTFFIGNLVCVLFRAGMDKRGRILRRIVLPLHSLLFYCST